MNSYNYGKQWQLLIVMAAFGTSVSPGIASAQADDPAIEEIIVTATKRSSTLQETPISISAFSMQQLDKYDIRNTDDLASIVPGLNIGVSVGNTQISLRGVSNDSFFLAGDPTVAFHQDGIYRGRQTGGMAMYNDLERVEVLKGPQGTLYGRNATAGSINVITAKPNSEFGGYVDVVAGDFNRFGVRGAINIPVNDKFAVRIAGFNESRDGYFDNGPLIQNDYSDQDESGIRLHALYEPSDRSSWLFTYDTSERGGVGDGTNLQPDADSSLEEFIDGALGDPFSINLSTEGVRDDEFTTTRLEFDHTFGFADFTYIGAYFESSVDIFIDFDRRDSIDQTLFIRVASEQWSHEFHLKSNDDGPLQWIAGLYIFDEDALRLLDIDIVPVVFIDNSQPDFQVESRAVFGQVTYGVSDAVNITAGLRYTEDKKSESGTVQQRITPAGTFIGFGDQTGDWDSVDWKFGVDWSPADNNMLYASIGTGYKSGGFNDPLLNLADPIFQPEEILAVQLGHKTQFSDGRLQINSELFWYDYTDMQVNQIVNLLNIVQNASSSKIFGLDTEIIAAPTDNWLLRLSVTYLNTEYENFTAFDAVTGEFEDMDGKDLVKAPEWSLFGGIEYTFEFANGWRLIPQIAVSYESESKRRVVSDPGALQPAYTRTNANLALESSDGSWEVQAFVTNIEDDFVATGVGLNGNNERTISGQPPRMYGVRVRYGFGE